jgi:hypothetical protein
MNQTLLNVCKLNNTKIQKKYCFNIFDNPKQCYIIDSDKIPGQQCFSSQSECQNEIQYINSILSQPIFINENFTVIKKYQ